MINLVSNCIYTYYSIVDLVLQYSSTKFRTGTCAENSGAAQSWRVGTLLLQRAIAIVKWPIMMAMQRTNQRRSVRTVFGPDKVPPTQCMPSVTTPSQPSRLAAKKIFFFASLLSVYPFKKLVQVLRELYCQSQETRQAGRFKKQAQVCYNSELIPNL